MLLWLAPCGRDKINFSISSVVNTCEHLALEVVNTSGFLVPLPSVAHSSRGLGHLPLKEEITGSNPVCATNSWYAELPLRKFYLYPGQLQGEQQDSFAPILICV